MLFSRLLIFFQNNFFEKLFQEYRLCFVGPDIGRHCLQRLSADNTRKQRIKCLKNKSIYLYLQKYSSYTVWAFLLMFGIDTYHQLSVQRLLISILSQYFSHLRYSKNLLNFKSLNAEFLKWNLPVDVLD